MTKAKLTTEQKEANKLARQEARKAAKEAARIEAERNQKPVQSIDISIEWRKSRTWGSNPYLEAFVMFKDGSGQRLNFTCSGCGYDKESTVIAELFNAVLKYKLWAKTEQELIRNDYKWKDENGAPYGVYGVDNYRYFGGGIGTDCYFAISEYIGGKFERVASGRTYDAYKYTDLS